jgi:hypothetical protein
MRWSRLAVAPGALVLMTTAAAAGGMRSMTTVTLDDLLPTRILEVQTDTEVIFADPRFLSVEVVADEGAPTALRIPGGFAALFSIPGTFRFISIVSGFERAERVPGEVIVRAPPGGATLPDFRAPRSGVTEEQFRAAEAECLRDPRAAGSVVLYRMCMQARGVIPF